MRGEESTEMEERIKRTAPSATMRRRRRREEKDGEEKDDDEGQTKSRKERK